MIQKNNKITLRNKWLNDLKHKSLIVISALIFLLLSEYVFTLPRIHDDWLKPFKLLVEHVQFTDFFFRLHRHSDVPIVDGRQVVVLDISEYSTRKEIASLLGSVADVEPYAVALDVIFGPIAATDSLMDRKLVTAINRLPNVVLASVMRPTVDGKFSYDQSFFTEEVQTTEAVSNFPSTIIREWSPKLVFEQDTMISFDAAVLAKMGIEIPHQADHWLVDYSINDIVVFNPKNSFDWTFLRNQVVLIGDINDLRDLQLIPVSYQASTRVSGVMVHKQILQTAMSGHWFRRIHTVWFWVILFILMWSYSVSQKIVATYIEEVCEQENRDIYKKVAKKIVFCLIFSIFLAFSYGLFWNHFLYFDVTKMLLYIGVIGVIEWFLKKVQQNVKMWKAYIQRKNLKSSIQ